MRKEQLIRALLKIAKNKEKEKAERNAVKGSTKSDSKTPNRISTSKSKPAGRNTKRKSATRSIPQSSQSAIATRIRAERERDENRKNLAEICARNLIKKHRNWIA